MTHNDIKNSSKYRKVDFDDAPLFAGLENDFLPTVFSNQKTDLIGNNVSTEKKKTKRQPQKTLPETDVVNLEKNQNSQGIKTRPAALFLSVADLCSLLSISRATLVRMDKNDAVPGRVKLGGSVRYHRETIEKWLTDLVDKK
ncbi:helix-turn-helix transcriptional regulator [Pelotalea chapellei]|uniref:Helix-turn-helix domain-containing protein n=1 Tax=Pelotalea chapellei TaxID=44671 RepID=A0ABS5U7H5_9BACT|nr:helix-turn-helix domain-containing protein [Pelotalea chapellei]MBT1071628.1 helix-turn-helix domain-containing protein [Pelotalea chapellei]